MAYLDVMVLPVKKDGRKAYVKMVKVMAKAFKKHGALEYHEAWGEDVKPGKLTSFPQSVDLKPDETVAVAYLVFKTKAARNKCWDKFMKDPTVMNYDRSNIPFDMKRMFFGGFKTLHKF
jgi:uncharacterized protein YbaA (DUF1428 family)